jgi:GNAT superfamily N-acetyltransferase
MAMTVFVTDNHNEADVIHLLERFVDESIFNKCVGNPVVIKENIRHILSNADSLVIVAYQNEKPVGIAIAIHWFHPFLSLEFVTDSMLFVIPEARGTMIGTGFIKRIELWAKSLGVKDMYMGQSSGIGDYERMAEFYKKHGYEITGVNCKKDL